MAKVAIKSEKLTPFGGIFSIMEQFDSRLSSVIDSTLSVVPCPSKAAALPPNTPLEKYRMLLPDKWKENR